MIIDVKDLGEQFAHTLIKKNKSKPKRNVDGQLRKRLSSYINAEKKRNQ